MRAGPKALLSRENGFGDLDCDDFFLKELSFIKVEFLPPGARPLL